MFTFCSAVSLLVCVAVCPVWQGHYELNGRFVAVYGSLWDACQTIPKNLAVATVGTVLGIHARNLVLIVIVSASGALLGHKANSILEDHRRRLERRRSRAGLCHK